MRELEVDEEKNCRVDPHCRTSSDPQTAGKWDLNVSDNIWTKHTCEWDRWTDLEKMIHSTTLLHGGVVREPVYL